MFCQTFYRSNLSIRNGYGKHQTASDRLTTHQHCTCAAHAMFTANVRSCQPTFLAQEIAKQHARLNCRTILAAIHMKSNWCQRISLDPLHDRSEEHTSELQSRQY